MTQTNFREILQSAGLTHKDIAACATPANAIASGTTSTVYNIPQLPDFVLLLSQGYEIAGLTEDDIQDIEDILPGTNIGQPVAGIEKSFLILRKQPGVKHGVPYSLIEDGWSEKAENTYADAIQRAAQMPQSAYDQFAQTLKQLDQAGAWFDCLGDNVLIDEAQGLFNLVDVRKVDEAPVGGRQGLASMLLALASYMICAYQVENKNRLSSQFQTIFQKCKLACANTGLPTEIDREMSSYVADLGIRLVS